MKFFDASKLNPSKKPLKRGKNATRRSIQYKKQERFPPFKVENVLVSSGKSSDKI